MIADKYVDRVIYVIEGSTLKKKELKDDLIDHFCCLIEMDMNKGMDFETAFDRAHAQTCPNGLDEIQRETVFLLNYNRIMLMKKLTYLIGFFATLSVSLGTILKILHWPVAEWFLLVGIVGVVFLFLPLLLINKFKRIASQAAIEKTKWIFGILSAMVFGAGATFKIMHWPGAAVLLALAFLFFSFGFLPVIFFRMYKKSIEEI